MVNHAGRSKRFKDNYRKIMHTFAAAAAVVVTFVAIRI